MTLVNVFYALLLGLLEGLTEFIPVSSTGHLALAKTALGLDAPFWDAFIILIQLGAILAVVVIYFQKFWQVLVTLPSDGSSRRFVLSVLIAFIPSAILGLLLHKKIDLLLQNPAIICWSLIIGGAILLVVDRWKLKPRHHDAYQMPFLVAFGVGCYQVLAMVPGVSRSGATIVGGMVSGADKRAAAEFSFFLAIPTMLGAFVVDFLSHRHELAAPGAMGLVAIGFFASFVFGWVVVKAMLGFVQHRGYAVFGWWRIAVGILGLFILH